MGKLERHLVFGLKFYFIIKVKLVLNEHKTPNTTGSTYAAVVSIESIRISFIYAALNFIDVFAADIHNAYLQDPYSQKEYIICGPEFDIENVGKATLIHRALYDRKSAGHKFRNHLRSCIRHHYFN